MSINKIILFLLSLLTVFFVFSNVKNALAYERVFYEDCEDTYSSQIYGTSYNAATGGCNLPDGTPANEPHFLERNYGSTHGSHWACMTNAITQSSDAHTGNYSMTYDPFVVGNPHAVVGAGDVPYGNTSNFHLRDYSSRYWYFRWYQKWQENIDWGGYLVKLLYVNYRDTPDFTYLIIKNGNGNNLSTLKDYDTYSLVNNRYVSAPITDDMQWHKLELLLDVGTNGNSDGSILFKIDNTIVVNESGLKYNDTISDNPIGHITGWPSNRSGVGGSGTAQTWLDDLEIYTLDNENDIPPEIGQTSQCSDGVDNDSDGLIDYPNDLGCSSSTDNDETDVLNTNNRWTWTADFEDGVSGTRAFGDSGFNGLDTGVHTYFDSTHAHSGTKSALFHWTAGDGGYANCTGQVIYPETLKEGDEVWIRAYYYFDNNWSWDNYNNESGGTKIMRHHNSLSDGGNARYSSIYTRTLGNISMSLEPSDVDYEYGSNVYFDIGKWQAIELYVKLDSSRGIVRIWKNGQLVHEVTQYNTMINPSDVGDWAFFMSTWNGGAPQDQDMWIDDIEITNQVPANSDDFGNPMIGLIEDIDSRADVDNNSQINTTDAMLTLRDSVGLDMSGTNWQSSSTTGDADCDGDTDSTDAMLILRDSLGLGMSGTGWCVD